jgi:hypothetical protein
MLRILLVSLLFVLVIPAVASDLDEILGGLVVGYLIYDAIDDVGDATSYRHHAPPPRPGIYQHDVWGRPIHRYHDPNPPVWGHGWGHRPPTRYGWGYGPPVVQKPHRDPPVVIRGHKHRSSGSHLHTGGGRGRR